MTDTDRLMTTRETAEYLGYENRSFQNLHNRGEGPPFYRISRKSVRYRKSEVDAWLEARRVA